MQMEVASELDLCTRFFYKNVLYKNVEAEICRKFKNVLRMFQAHIQISVEIFLRTYINNGDVGFVH